MVAPKQTVAATKSAQDRKQSDRGEVDDLRSDIRDVVQSPGQPLELTTKALFERRFGHDFRNVRVHADAGAAASARDLGARAYTVGQHIVLGRPSGGEPQHIAALAHELAHTLQQEPLRGKADYADLRLGPPILEREADAMARSALQGMGSQPNPARVAPVIQRQKETGIDLEVPDPAEAERLRAQGVNLPKVSAVSANPRNHTDFVDNRLIAVGWGVYLFGAHVYVSELALPVFVPNAYIDLNLHNAVPINESIYPSRDAALKDVPLGPWAANQPVPFAYYRATGGLVVPTIFSPATTPKTIDTLLSAMSEVGKQVANELTVLALSLVGAMLLRGIFSRIARVGEDEAGPPVARDPISLGRKIGEEVRVCRPAGERRSPRRFPPQSFRKATPLPRRGKRLKRRLEESRRR